VPLPFTALAQFIADRLNRSDSTPAPTLPTTAATGSYGERVASAFLHRRGYRVLYRNYKTERGEIDLICRLGKILVFVEVRTRANDQFGRPVESIDPAKESALRYAADHYLALLERNDLYYRFDAVEIILHPGQVPDCTLYPDLFS
jgi:putative endonuclease